jgi:sterol desaturase/sphingolipid hydroxylase (fatty acid hydroxylase superfamily)
MSAAFIPFLVPIGLLLFLLEVYFLRKNQIKITLEQTALNISLGFLERLLGLYLTEKSILLVNKSLDFAFFETLPKTWWVLAITFIALDLIWYIFHLAGHRISLMWGIHLVHHHSEEFNLSVNFALSPLGFILRSFMYCSLVVFGLPVEYVILSSYLNAFYQYYLHTQFINTIPYLEKVFVMPAHHQVHHGSNELYLDKNFGGVFIFWDRLFRTYQPLVEPVNYGLTAALPHRDFFNLQTFFSRNS